MSPQATKNLTTADALLDEAEAAAARGTLTTEQRDATLRRVDELLSAAPAGNPYHAALDARFAAIEDVTIQQKRRLVELQKQLADRYENASPEDRAAMDYRRTVRETILALKDEVAQLKAQLAERGAASIADSHRGTWDADQPYSRGDVVASDKSSWVAMRDVTGERPGTSPAWRILAGRGRDGRDRR
jgi:hypothetical protein